MEERSAVFEIIMVQLFQTGAVLMSETEKGKGRSIPAFRFGCPSREQVSPPWVRHCRVWESAIRRFGITLNYRRGQPCAGAWGRFAAFLRMVSPPFRSHQVTSDDQCRRPLQM